jgi:anti-sigma factor (TIGR02949 family)
MNHEHCRDLLHSLSEYLDGTLDEQLCMEIDRHMSGCEDCRMVIDSLRKTISLYHTTSQNISVPEEMRQRLFHRLNLDDYLRE